MNLEVATQNSAYLTFFGAEEFGEDNLYLDIPEYDMELKNADNDAFELKLQNIYDLT